MVDRIRLWIAQLDDWSLRHRSTRVARRAMEGFLRHEALQYAGSMAYFGVLSIFQLLVLGVVLFSLFLGDERARAFVLEQVQAGSPLDPATINGVIDAVIQSRGGITIISGAFLFWSALGVFSSLSSGIERAFESPKRRPFLQDKLVGLFLMAITGVLAVGSLVIGIATGIVQAATADVLARVPGGGVALGSHRPCRPGDSHLHCIRGDLPDRAESACEPARGLAGRPRGGVAVDGLASWLHVLRDADCPLRLGLRSHLDRCHAPRLPLLRQRHRAGRCGGFARQRDGGPADAARAASIRCTRRDRCRERAATWRWPLDTRAGRRRRGGRGGSARRPLQPSRSGVAPSTPG